VQKEENRYRVLRWRRIHSILTGMFVALACYFLSQASFFHAVELKTLDTRFRLRGSSPVESPLAVVFIGEDSIKAFGRWPWSWDHHALLIDTLKRAGARQVLFDIFFTESPGSQDESFLASVTELAGNVYYCSHFNELKERDRDQMLIGDSLNEPIASLAGSAAGIGHCNARLDLDGNMRRIPLTVRHEGTIYPSAPLRVALDHLGASLDDLKTDEAGSIVLQPPGRTPLTIPLDEKGQAMINFIGDQDSFPSYSFRQVLEAGRYPDRAAIDLEVFRGRIVLVGATFAGNTDLRPSPFAADNPMVLTLATVIDNILEGSFLWTPSWHVGLLMILLLGGLAGALMYSFKALVSLAVSAVLGLAYIAGAQAVFNGLRWNLQIVAPLMTFLSTYILVTSFRYFLEERRARTIRNMFSNYATERLVNEMVANPSLARLGGERRKVTVLFADIRGFTAFSEKHPAEVVVSQLNEYLGAMTGIIFRWEGTVDKFIGDAIVAFWGAPLRQENHAELALRCSLHMINEVESLQEKWSAAGRAPWSIGIGLNTGDVIVGNVGAEGKKMDYTVIGDPVNLGARVESLTRKLNSNILLTEFTMEELRELLSTGNFGHLAVRGMGKVTVKGKKEEVNIFQVSSKESGSDTEIVEYDPRQPPPRSGEGTG